MKISVNLVQPVEMQFKMDEKGSSYAYCRAKVAYNDPVTRATTFMNTYFSGDDAGKVASLTTRDWFDITVPDERIRSMTKEFIDQESGEIKKYNDIGRASHVEVRSYASVRDAKKAEGMTAMSNPGFVA